MEALETGRDPPLEWRASDHPLEELRELDERLSDARAAQAPATVALTLALIALVALALLTRSALLARGALLYPLGAIALALGASALHLVGPLVTTLIVLAAAPLALVAAARVPLTLAVPVFLAGVRARARALARDERADGDRPVPLERLRASTGVNNQIETLLLGTGARRRGPAARLAARCARAALARRGRREQDGRGRRRHPGVRSRLRGARGTPPRPRARDPARAARRRRCSALAFVGLDALAGGSSHVTDAVSGGPGELFDTYRDRLERSVSIATSTVWQLAILAGGRRRARAYFAALKPRYPVVDAYLVAIAVSLVVNDSPTKVAGYGAIVCGALRAWSVSRERARDRIDDVRKLVLFSPRSCSSSHPRVRRRGGGAATAGDRRGNAPAETAAARCHGRRPREGQGDLRVRGLRRLPHVLRRRIDRHGRARTSTMRASTSTPSVTADRQNGGGGMPAFGDRLSDQEIADVAAFVTQCAC